MVLFIYMFLALLLIEWNDLKCVCFVSCSLFFGNLYIYVAWHGKAHISGEGHGVSQCSQYCMYSGCSCV